MKIVLILVLLGCVFTAPILETAKQCLDCYHDKEKKVCTNASGLPTCCEKDDDQGSCNCVESKG